jgi:FG-GAP repeat
MRDAPLVRLVLHSSALVGLAVVAHAQTGFYTWTGDSANDSLGYAVGAAGDVNADGWPDVITGARDDDPSGISGAGSAYVWSGKDGTLIWAVHGTQLNEKFGYSVNGVGDLNHDGFADFAVGAPGWDNAVMVPDVGAVHVYNGKTGTKFFAFGGQETNSQYGSSVAGCGDWSGDGTLDIVVGAPGYTNVVFGTPHPGSGRAIIISGTVPSSILHTFNGVDDGENFGWSVANAGDWDADGFTDIVVGSPFSPTSVASGGKARVYSGQFKSLLFTAQGAVAGGSLGIGVGGAGDVNGDGKDDIVVGAYGEGGNAGAVRVYLGSAGTPSWIKPGDAANDRLGYAVCGVGDANKDGFDDFAGGGYQAAGAGYAKVWSGKDGSVLYNKILAPAGGEQFGSAIAGPGDLDQDGWVDLVVGDSAYNAPSGTDAGGAFAYDIVVHQANFGFGGPGAAFLEMYGTPLATGGKADLHLSGAKASAPSWLVAATSTALIGFKGGVLVPNVAAGLVLPFTTTAQGQVSLTSIAGGGGPVTVYLQFIVKDAAQPHGFALSNAVAASILP